MFTKNDVEITNHLRYLQNIHLEISEYKDYFNKSI